MIHTIVFSLIILWFPCLAIEESYSITDILKYVDPSIPPERTLIVLDLDNMVVINEVEPGDHLGSPEWLSAMIRKKMEISGITKLQALEYTLPIHFRVAPHIVLLPAEGVITVAFIRMLQDAGYKVIALTARSAAYLKDDTIQGLRKLGIDFNRSKIGDDHIFDDRFQYVAGIAFVAGADKGQRLWRLLLFLEYMPENIILADDKDYYLYEYEGVLKQYGLRHTCLWYRYCDKMINTYDLDQSQATLSKLCASDPQLDTIYNFWLQADINHEYFYRQYS